MTTVHGGGATTGAEQTRRTEALRYFGEDCRLSARSYEPVEETAAQWLQWPPVVGLSQPSREQTGT